MLFNFCSKIIVPAPICNLRLKSVKFWADVYRRDNNNSKTKAKVETQSFQRDIQVEEKHFGYTYLSFLTNYMYLWLLTDILLANGDELNLNLPKFTRPLSFSFASGFLALS